MAKLMNLVSDSIAKYSKVSLPEALGDSKIVEVKPVLREINQVGKISIDFQPSEV